MATSNTVTTNMGVDVIPVDKLAAAIKRTITTARDQEKRMQLLSISCIYATFNDATHATMIGNLLRDFPKGSRVEYWAAWVTRHFPMIQLDTKKRTVRIHKFYKDDEGNAIDYTADDWDFASADSEMWFTKPESAQKSNVLDVESLVKRIEKLADESAKTERTPELVRFAIDLKASKAYQALVKKYSELEAAHTLELDAQVAEADAKAAEIEAKQAA